MDNIDPKHMITRSTIAAYDVGDGVKSWGRRGLLGGGVFGFVLGVMFAAIPNSSDILTFGLAGTLIVATVEGAVIAGALGACAAALYGKGVLRGSTADMGQLRSSPCRRPHGWQDGDIPLSNWPAKWAYPGPTAALSHQTKDIRDDTRIEQRR